MPVSINLSRHAADIHADRDADGSKTSRILSCIERGMVILMSVVGSLLRRRLILPTSSSMCIDKTTLDGRLDRSTIQELPCLDDKHRRLGQNPARTYDIQSSNQPLLVCFGKIISGVKQVIDHDNVVFLCPFTLNVGVLEVIRDFQLDLH